MKGERSIGLDAAISQDDATITGSRLPTSKLVLRCMLFHLKDIFPQNRTKYEAAKIVLSHISPFCVKGGIPMLTEQGYYHKIIKLLENEKFHRTLKARRAGATMITKLQ